MAKEKYNDEDGVWRTIGGRKVFIRKGQSVADAMIESGKFKGQKNKPGARESYRQEKEKDYKEQEELYDKYKKANEETSNVQEEAHEYMKKVADNNEKYEDTYEKRKEREDRQEQVDKERGKAEPVREKEDESTNEEQERLDIARDIAKEMYQLNDNNSTQEKIDRYARNIMEYTDGEVTNETPYKDKNGNIQRSTQSLRDWREELNKTKEPKSTNDYGGNKALYDLENSKYSSKEKLERAKEKVKNKNISNDERQYYQDYIEKREGKSIKDIISDNKSTNEAMNNAIREKASNKYEGTKRWGFGYANDDNVPVYNNKIDYTGDFTHANLQTLSDSELKEALNKQTELLNKANAEKVGDRRTRNGRMQAIFNKSEKLQYNNGVNRIKEELVRRENEKYPQYKGTPYEVKYYSLEDVMKDKDSPLNQYIRNKADEKKAYRQYLKDHPESKMSLKEFRNMKK